MGAERAYAFFKGILSLSGSMPCIAINTSAGVSTGPECEDPCNCASSINTKLRSYTAKKILAWMLYYVFTNHISLPLEHYADSSFLIDSN